ncbi:hypothetical protein K1T71_004798 [Dendrolimus kikuchii]|uniref:Uncharacterized protein n=1 Tax=Dendrolimus kikuchii TaxID=765133 RepID=A0ACC1D576_9NEOP|nr:hypothetical protein K1T71_004798 [Dendrolimus kikuchii]
MPTLTRGRDALLAADKIFKPCSLKQQTEIRSPIGSKSSLCEESTEMYADGRTTNVPTLSRAHVAALRGNTTVGTSTETSGTVYRGTTRRTRAVTAAAAAVANAVNAAHVQELPASSALNALHVA